MKSIFIAIVFLVISFCPYLARANSTLQNPSLPPDITSWNVVNISRTVLQVSDVTVAYVGLEVKYSNPTNPKEFIIVIRRHIPLIVSKSKNQNGRSLGEAVIVFYNQKEEQDRLAEVSKKSDPIIYTRWRTKKNPHTGHDMLDGDFEVWFLSPEGDWVFIKNQEVETEFMTENVGNGKPHNVFSGMKYQVGNMYHIIRVDRNDLLKLFVGEK